MTPAVPTSSSSLWWWWSSSSSITTVRRRPPPPPPSTHHSHLNHHNRRCSRRRLDLVALLCLLVAVLTPPLADAVFTPAGDSRTTSGNAPGPTEVPIVPDHAFAFDGTHSDYAQQFYIRHAAGDSAPRLGIRSDRLPDEVRTELSRHELSWGELPGLLQRAMLWDLGYALDLSDRVVAIHTRCGRSMAEIFVPRKAYERIGCVPKACALPDGSGNGSSNNSSNGVFYRHQSCDGNQAARISLCAAENAIEPGHTAMWGDGADATLLPEVTLVRHAWVDANDTSFLMFALHAVRSPAAYNTCPTRPSPIIPCAPYAQVANQSEFCRPIRGRIVRLWLKNLAAEMRPSHQWVLIEVVLVTMLIGSNCYGLWNRIEDKKRRTKKRALRQALLATAMQFDTDSEDGRERTTVPADDEDDERALEDEARAHFASVIGISASAHNSSSSTTRRLSYPMKSSDSECRRQPRRPSSDLDGGGYEELGSGSGGDGRRGSPRRPRHLSNRSLSGVENLEHSRTSSSTTSSIVFLSKSHRNHVAIRSFHLFESHSLIRRRRVPFREIQFQRPVSQGASGEVWLATLRGERVAVKQLLPGKRRKLKEMELFLAEIYLLSQLQHPHIVSLLGVAWNTLAHVVMIQEWMNRGDLQQYLAFQLESQRAARARDHEDGAGTGGETHSDGGDSRRTLAASSVKSGSTTGGTDFSWDGAKLQVARGVASALAYMHNLTPQLLHRDIKSKNVLLSSSMDVKLGDFGISRRKHQIDDDSNLTVTEAAGTMSWTAPEVLLGEDYGEKIDIYSFGILLCEVDTCSLPYHDPQSMAERLIFHPLRLMRLVIHEGRRPALSPTCPPRIASLIHACLDRDPTRRPSAEAIVAYLSSDSIV